MQRPVINAFLRKIARAAIVVAVVLLICAFVPGLVWLLNSLSSLITALATIAIALYTWALRDSTNRLWEAGQRQFELEGPFLHPVIQSNTIHEGFRGFILFDHPTSPVPSVAPEASFTIRNFGRSPALLKSVAAEMGHWTEMVPKPRVDFLARYDVEPVIEPGDETKQVFTEPVTIPIDDRVAFESLKSGNSHLFLYGEIAFSDLLGVDYVQTSVSPTTTTPSNLSAGKAATTDPPAPPTPRARRTDSAVVTGRGVSVRAVEALFASLAAFWAFRLG